MQVENHKSTACYIARALANSDGTDSHLNYLAQVRHANVTGTPMPRFHYSKCERYRVYHSHDFLLCDIFETIKSWSLHYPILIHKDHGGRCNGFGRGRDFSFSVKEHWISNGKRFTSDKVLHIQAGHHGVFKSDSLPFNNQILIGTEEQRINSIKAGEEFMDFIVYDYDAHGYFISDDMAFCDAAARIHNKIMEILNITGRNWTLVKG